MKKLLALLLAMVMVLSLAACGDNDNDKDNKSEGSQKNTYETPLELTMKEANEKDASKVMERRIAILNGLCEEEYKAMLEILKKSEDYNEEEIEERYEEQIEEMKDEFGSDYKYAYKIEEKETLDKDELKDLQDDLKDFKNLLEEFLERTKDLDSSDWGDLADEMGLSVSDAKDVVSVLEDVCKVMDEAKVTEGYRLSVTVTVKGSNLEEPKEETSTICVYKIGGRWIAENALSMLSSFGNLM